MKIVTKEDGVEPRWLRRKEERPKEILEAALTLFSEKGFALTRLDDVAKKAGVSKGTLYLYFKDKEEIFKKVVETGIIPNIEEMELEISKLKNKECVEELIELIISKMALIVTTTSLGAIPKIMISEAGNFPNLTVFYRDEVVLRLHLLIGKVIEKGIEQKVFRPIPVFDAARVLLSNVFMMAIATNMPGFKEKLRIDIDKQVETTLDIWFRGVRVNSDGGAK